LLLKSHGLYSGAVVVSRNIFQQAKRSTVTQKKHLLQNNFITLLGMTQERLSHCSLFT